MESLNLIKTIVPIVADAFVSGAVVWFTIRSLKKSPEEKAKIKEQKSLKKALKLKKQVEKLSSCAQTNILDILNKEGE